MVERVSYALAQQSGMITQQSNTLTQQSNTLEQLHSLIAMQMEIIKDLKSEVAELKGN